MPQNSTFLANDNRQVERKAIRKCRLKCYRYFIWPYYMASSVRGQDKSNPALWLATRAGKMELSCPLRTTRRVPQERFPRKQYNKSLIDQACSVKMAGYWPRSFFASLWTSTPSRSINTQKKKLGQYPAILTSHLVNNPYINQNQMFFNHFVIIAIYHIFISRLN